MSSEPTTFDGAPVHGDLEPDAEAFLRRFLAWGRAASVAGYIELFDDEATLWDAPMETGLTKAGIGPAIAATLAVAPDFRFAAERIAVGGRQTFVEARNEATVGGQRLSWVAVYCVQRRGDRVLRGRRSYDQCELQGRLVDGFAHPLRRSGSAHPTAVVPGAWLVADLPGRAAAWAALDADALVPPGAVLRGPGIDGGLGGADVARYLGDLAGLAALEVTADVVVGDDRARFVEWVGRAVRRADGASLPFRMVERLAPEGEGTGWRLSFDVLHLRG